MKSTKTQILFPILILILLSSSCSKDWFDEKSDKNLTVPSTLQDFEYLLDDYDIMAIVSPGMGEIASDGHYIPESRWQSLPVTGLNDQKNAFTWTNKFLFEDVKDWDWNYKKIFQCNLVLEGLKKIEPDERANQVRGNALFHRAKSFFELAQVFAQPYIKESASRDLGIPLKNGVDVTQSPQRASVQETYNKIIEDLTTAIELLPIRPLYLTRGSKLSCYGLLARVYLSIGNYERAFFYSNAVLDVENALIDFNTIPSDNIDMGLFNAEVIYHSLLCNYEFLFVPEFIFIDESLYDSYDDDDLRKTRFFNKQPNGIVFKGMYNNNILQFSGLATDEMYMIRAECKARMGQIAEAMKDLNDLLRTRWKKNEDGTSKYIEQSANNQFEALSIILSERRKELLLRGLRWTDLRRLNIDDRFKTTLTRTVAGQTYILEPNSYKYTFPIPDDEIALSGIQQNPGWER